MTMKARWVVLCLSAALAASAVADHSTAAATAAEQAASAAGKATAATQRALGDLGKVGTVKFPTSCDPALQAEFERGVALLHSFFYREARRVFVEVARKDPECAMAHWGIAMSYYHPIWTAPDSAELAAGTAAVEKALAAKKTSEREREFIRAIEAYYKGLDTPDLAAAEPAPAPSCHGGAVVDSKGRAACFKREMEKLVTRHPDDVDGAAFFALSLLATAPVGDPELRNQKQSAALLEKWYAQKPRHPGLAHYLIHSYDYPPLAAKGLPAAQAYAGIAPEVPHALHMPSHIFTRLGMWEETIRSNQASAEAARKYAAANHPEAASFEELHALDYMAYAYLQTAQDGKAKEVVDRLARVDRTQPEVDFAAGYAIGAIPARFALERRQWKEAAALERSPMSFWGRLPFAEGHLAYARAVGAVRSGDLERARAAAGRLEELARASTDPRFRYFADQMGIQRKAALALIALAEGKREEAIGQLRRAAAEEDSLGKHPVSPGAMLPVRELLAESLLETGRAEEALAEFEASLKLNPGRFNAVYGAAKAAEKAGKRAEARRYYGQLVALAKAGEGRRAELDEARAYLAKS
jgi:tetratricopeptide (TPR) repeat protein